MLSVLSMNGVAMGHQMPLVFCTHKPSVAKPLIPFTDTNQAADSFAWKWPMIVSDTDKPGLFQINHLSALIVPDQADASRDKSHSKRHSSIFLSSFSTAARRTKADTNGYYL